MTPPAPRSGRSRARPEAWGSGSAGRRLPPPGPPPIPPAPPPYHRTPPNPFLSHPFPPPPTSPLRFLIGVQRMLPVTLEPLLLPVLSFETALPLPVTRTVPWSGTAGESVRSVSRSRPSARATPAERTRAARRASTRMRPTFRGEDHRNAGTADRVAVVPAGVKARMAPHPLLSVRRPRGRSR